MVRSFATPSPRASAPPPRSSAPPSASACGSWLRGITIQGQA